LFALGVRHWASSTFSLLVLTGIVYYFARYRRHPVELHKYEKWYLWGLLTYFIFFLFSFSINPFDSLGDTRFGNEIRFLLVIPLYLLVAKYKQGIHCLVAGSVGALIIGFGFCLYELYIKGHSVFLGEYSKLFTGPVMLIYLVVVLSYFIPKLRKDTPYLWSGLIGLVLIATFSIIAAEVRAAYIGYVILSLLFVSVYIRGWKKLATLIILLTSLSVMSIYSSAINSRMTIAYDELTNYLSMQDHTDPKNNAAGSSVGVRLEMWRSTPLFIKDNPLFGVGNGNYQKSVVKYIKQGKVHPAAGQFYHPHNVFIGAVIDKGLLGLAATLFVCFFPLYVYLKTYRINKYAALTGILYVITMWILSMNETAPFEKSNFLATYLIYSLVIFQNHMHALKNTQKVTQSS
jgi:O-antigen ligase